MKKTIYLGIFLLFLTTVVFAQVPLGFNYQAAIRNAEGEPIANQTVGLRIGIVQESITGTVVYSEEHMAETNAFGIVNLMIGSGDVQSGVFAEIDWSLANYFIKIELDAENNGNYVTMGVSQLLSVPFANYAFSGNAGASAYEVWLSLGNIGTEDNFINSLTGPDGEQGEPGISAYEEWLALGNTGTEADFLNSLTGTDGDPGADGSSAYEVWLSLGNTGTEEEFINSLAGPEGTQGEPGMSAYEVWLSLGNEGTEEEFINSLTGPQGVQGEIGSSAYEVWLSLGNTGTEEEFINSLVGPQGETGPSAYDVWLSLGNTGSEDDFINSLTGPSGTSSWTDGEEAVSTTKNVGIGTANPTSSLQIIAPESVKAGDPIFEVKNAFGKTVFAVYENEVKVFVEDTTTASGGFTVNSRNAAEVTQELMAVGPQQTVVYVDESVKESVGGFAISGRTATKGVQDLLRVTSGLTEFFVEEPLAKESVGGFAISGRTANKGLVDVVNITPYSTNFYVDTTPAKESVGGFAISGRTANKGVGNEMFKVVPGFTEIFVPASGAKESVGGFAISGRTANKGLQGVMRVTASLTEFFVEEPTVKESVGGFAISGRTANKGLVDVMNITPFSTNFYVDTTTTAKESVGGFAISGRTANKGVGDEMFRVIPGLTEVFVEESLTKESVGGFAISGRTAGKVNETYNVMHVQPQSTDIYIKPNQNKMLPDGFRIFGMNPLDMAAEPVEFFNVSEQGVVINTNMTVAPEVATDAVYAVSQDSAFCSGFVTDSIDVDIVAFGFVYSSSVQPSLTMDTTVVSSGVVHGAGSSEAFNAYLKDLEINTTYTVRAFATNAEGVTGYGTPKVFTTDGLYSYIFDPRTSLNEDPITDAIIGVWPLPSGDTIYNSVGEYEFFLLEGSYGYSIEAPLSIPTEGEITVNSVNDPNYVVLEDVVPLDVDIYVSDVLSQPVEGASVELDSGLGNIQGFTHEGGFVSLNLMPGIYNYTVSKDEMYINSTGVIEVEYTGMQSFDTELQYANPREILISVVDADSVAIAGAEVFLNSTVMGFYYQQFGISDADGEVLFGVVPDADYSLDVSHSNYMPYPTKAVPVTKSDTIVSMLFLMSKY